MVGDWRATVSGVTSARPGSVNPSAMTTPLRLSPMIGSRHGEPRQRQAGPRGGGEVLARFQRELSNERIGRARHPTFQGKCPRVDMTGRRLRSPNRQPGRADGSSRARQLGYRVAKGGLGCAKRRVQLALTSHDPIRQESIEDTPLPTRRHPRPSRQLSTARAAPRLGIVRLECRAEGQFQVDSTA
jgi:hypothetical protein